MKRFLLLSVFAIIGTLLIQSCQEPDELISSPSSELQLPATEYNYAVDVPAHVAPNLGGFNGSNNSSSEFDNTPTDNEITNAGATLGRVLFYDTKLSKNNAIACASCHHQQLAFSDKEAFSTGFEGIKTGRNSMPIANLRFHKTFFWDTNNITLEEQVLEPLKNHIEMGMEDMDFLVQKVSKAEYYPELFQNAFGSEEVNSDRISKALAQFLRSMVSFDSKFDQGVASNFSNFTEIEKMGHDLFMDHERTACGDCHAPASNFGATWRTHANIGLDMVYDDNGAGNGSFKVPSLRNVALTAPYMHDGRYNTLEEVIDHYSDNIQNHPNLDWSLRDGNGAKRMNLSPLEKKAMIAFLETLTDESYTEDVRFSTPFKQ